MKKVLTKKQTLVVLTAAMMTVLCTASAQAVMDANNIFDVNMVHSLYIILDNPNDFNAMRFSAGDDIGELPGQVYPTEVSPGDWEHDYWQAYLSDSNSGPWKAVAVRRKSDPALNNGSVDEVDPQKSSLNTDFREG